MKNWADLVRLIRRQELVPADATPLRGSADIWHLPLAMTIASVIEIVAIELLVNALWLRLLLLIMSIYGVLMMWGIIGGQLTRPHYATPTNIVLRHGREVLAVIPRTTITRIRHARGYCDERRVCDGNHLVLGGPNGTNVLIELSHPVKVAHDTWPWQKKRVSEVNAIELWLEKPADLSA
ncbi:hypothetical protein [Corynebacterium sp. H113]|uniref:hypothetical protein n=1 Tax=Corynebacterium sp. H113 TaxID=3133419 RepID=UPI00309F4AC1